MSNDSKCGLFLACYEIGSGKMGAISFQMHLSVYPPDKTVSGTGRIFQPVNPPLNITTRLEGDYTYMCVMPDTCHILVTATGYPILKSPPDGGPGPRVFPNVYLRMALTDDWKSGIANYSYLDSQGTWHEVNNAPVRFVEYNQDSVTNMGA